MAIGYEIERLRRDTLACCKKYGVAVMIRKVWTQIDYDEGLVAHCPVCYNSAYDQFENSNCARCYGTGFDGGYRAKVLTYGKYDRGGAERTTRKDGYLESWNVSMVLPHNPIVSDGDLVAEVGSFDANSVPDSIGVIYLVDGNVSYVNALGKTSYGHQGALRFADTLVSQSFSANHPLNLDSPVTTDAFWGV